MLRDGVGMPQDKSMALKYFNQAAASDYADANLLAQFLVQEGVKEPVRKSVASKRTGNVKKRKNIRCKPEVP